MNWIANYLFQQSIQIAAVFLLVSMLAWLLRSASAQVRYWLWLIVLGKCCVPPVVIVGLAVLPPATVPGSQHLENSFDESSARTAVPAHAALSQAGGLPSIDENDQATVTVQAKVAYDAFPTTSLSSSQPVPVGDFNAFDWRSTVVMGWALVVGLLLAYVATRAMAIRKYLNSARRPAGSVITTEVRMIARELGMKKSPSTYEVDTLSQPFVWGFLRGAIYLPSGFDHFIGLEHRRSILTHEIAHTQRWDAAINNLQLIVQTLFFFHPLVWWANRQIRSERERCCDEVVLASSAIAPRIYCEAIISCLCHSKTVTSSAPVLLVSGSVNEAKRRMKVMLSPNRVFRRRPSWRAIVLLLGMSSIALPTAFVLTPSMRSAFATIDHPFESRTDHYGDQQVVVNVEDGDGQPVEHAKIELFYWLKTNASPRLPHREFHETDRSGQLILNVPPNAWSPFVFVEKAGLVPQTRSWRSDFGEVIPNKLNLMLVPGIKIGGTIVDDRGNPIENVQVNVLIESKRVAFTDPPNLLNTYVLGGVRALSTDREGQWKYDGVPDDARIRLKLNHPDFCSDAAFDVDRPEITQSQYRDLSARVVMHHGIQLNGRVIDTEGSPVVGSVVRLQSNSAVSSPLVSVVTDDHGVFKLPAVEPGDYRVAAVAAGYAFGIQAVELRLDAEPIDLILEKGKSIRIRVVASDGTPVRAQCAVQWGENSSLLGIHQIQGAPDPAFPIFTDENGVFQWPNVPDGSYALICIAEGFEPQRTVAMAGGDELTVVLNPTSKLTARVVDQSTGQPIQPFDVFYLPQNSGFPQGQYPQRIPSTVYRPGEFEIDSPYCYRQRIIFEAIGYRTHVTEDTLHDMRDTKDLTFRLQPAESVTGSIVDAEGNPVAGAIVSVRLTDSLKAELDSTPPEFKRVLTNRSGNFRFPAPPESYSIFVSAKQGYARKHSSIDDANLGRIALQPFSTVQGVVSSEGVPLARVNITLFDGVERDQTHTDENGRFVFRDIFPGEIELTVHAATPSTAQKDDAILKPITRKLHVPSGGTVNVTVEF